MGILIPKPGKDSKLVAILRQVSLLSIIFKWVVQDHIQKHFKILEVLIPECPETLESISIPDIHETLFLMNVQSPQAFLKEASWNLFSSSYTFADELAAYCY